MKDILLLFILDTYRINTLRDERKYISQTIKCSRTKLIVGIHTNTI